jgi:hypothetical protein
MTTSKNQNSTCEGLVLKVVEKVEFDAELNETHDTTLKEALWD